MIRSGSRASRPAGLIGLAVIELLEALGLVVLTVLVVVGASGKYPLQTFGVAGTVLVLAALLVGVAVGALRGSPWTRTAGLVWHVVQILIGLYSLTGAGAAVGVAVITIVPAVVVIVLLFTRPVQEALARSAGAS
ncbi:hypothetical protein [uncultured Amnibacterium sp.]|uniref:hypothetical protein n=1 Tax=uncultured Amnibacterium sp. TaxID=1631851 RepID=UPI0035CA1822